MGITMLDTWVLARAINHDRGESKLVASLTPEQRGEVVSVGNKVKDIKKGDIIAYLFKEATPYQFDGVNYSLIKREEIVGIIEKGKNA